MATTRLLVVRHGERADEVDATVVTDDPALTGRGVAQAEAVAAHLLKARPEVDVICSSPFLRCVQTAAELLAGIKFVYGKEPSRAAEAPALLQVAACALHASVHAPVHAPVHAWSCVVFVSLLACLHAYMCA